MRWSCKHVLYESKVKITAVDALAPHVTRPSATMVLPLKGKQVLAIHKTPFEQPVPSQSGNDRNCKHNFPKQLGMQRVDSLWPGDALWQQRSWSTLFQVMACCLTVSVTPRHYLNQFWFVISKVLWHSLEGNFTRDTSATIHYNYLENVIPKISFKSPRDHEINSFNAGDRIFRLGWINTMPADALAT